MTAISPPPDPTARRTRRSSGAEARNLRVEDTLAGEDYDEFAWLQEVAEDAGLAFRAPRVRRRELDAPHGTLSALQWGEGEPRMVFLHGGRQNAHTWDAVLQDLDLPALAVDLPGHGRSYRRADGNYGPRAAAEALAAVLPVAAPQARTVVGMSLGALTAIPLAGLMGDWIERLVLVDATPPVERQPVDRTRATARGVADTQRLPRYARFEDMLAVAAALNPRRTAESLARETRLNARRLADGGWSWRFDAAGRLPQSPPYWAEMRSLWEDVPRIAAPTMFVRAEHSRFVADENIAQFRQALPGVRLEVVRASGHAVQTDQPRALAALIRDFCRP